LFRFILKQICLFQLFQYTFSFFFVQFETNLFVSVVSKYFLVRFGSFWNKSVCFDCFDVHPKHRNKPKQNLYWFRKGTETNAKQILFRLFSVRTEIFFYSFRGHPSSKYWRNIIVFDYAVLSIYNLFIYEGYQNWTII